MGLCLGCERYCNSHYYKDRDCYEGYIYNCHQKDNCCQSTNQTQSRCANVTPTNYYTATTTTKRYFPLNRGNNIYNNENTTGYYSYQVPPNTNRLSSRVPYS